MERRVAIDSMLDCIKKELLTNHSLLHECDERVYLRQMKLIISNVIDSKIRMTYDDDEISLPEEGLHNLQSTGY